MKYSAITRLAALAAIILPFGVAAPTPDLKIRNFNVTDVVPDSYIIVYKVDTTAAVIATHEEAVASMISKRSGFGHRGVGATYSIGNFKGYQIEADAATIAEISASPEVDYIEKDGIMYASTLTTQTGAPYGLGRISHRSPGSTSYIYDTKAGSGSRIYVVDTGIYIGHSQFGGRAVWGTNFISGSADTDENGHGTHCAGTAAGSTYGVSKSATLVAVKVLDASGSGTNSGVISGIQWVATNAASLGVSSKSVLSMSLGGGLSTAVNSAVANTVSSGVTVVVAAGNDNVDAKNTSPASEPSAITVGATTSADARASFSNFGSILDIFAPGVNILSSWIGSTTATNTISGTSMATPHVAGLAAYLISLEGLSTPAAVVARIQSLATSGLITSAGSGSPNLIAYNGNGA